MRKIKAAKLALLANNSMIKVFQIAGLEVPTESIRASKKQCKSISMNIKEI